MRVLYLDINQKCLNPTMNLFPSLLCEQFDNVIFYGPNYTDLKILNKGIKDFLKNSDSFDIVIIGAWIPISSKQNKTASKFLEKGKLNKKIIKSFIEDIQTNIHNLPIKIKALLGLGLDYYAMRNEQVDFIKKNNLYVICPGLEFIKSLNEIPEYSSEEKHFRRKKNNFSDCWLDYVKNNKNKIINALHFVSSNDYFYKSLIDRKYDINIPGIDYYRRKQAKQFIKNLNFKMPNNFYFYIFRVLNKLGFPVFKNNFMINIFNNIFSLNLSESSIAYTAPGCFGMPIRKYFEIPASGALFICEPCNGFRSLGFKDGINCIFANPDELINKIDDALKISDIDKIAKAGQELMFNNHSITERGKQIKECFLSINENSYKSSKWVDGEFIIEKNK